MIGGSFAWMQYAGVSLAAIGLTIAAWLVLARPQSPVRIAWARYESFLEREARFLFKPYTGRLFARRQAAAVAAALVLPFALDMFELYILVPVLILAPSMKLRSEHDKRVIELESQLDTWLLLLSNALKATPSLGEAVGSSAKLVRAPLNQELDLLLKEVTLGTPFDKAIQNVADRIGSRTFSTAFATILIGRQTGGDLSRILEESASTLREMARLEGVVRSKTAEGRSQAVVLGAIPYFVVGALYFLDPNWMAPLFNTGFGKMIIFGAFLMWVSAIILAMRILKVDI